MKNATACDRDKHSCSIYSDQLASKKMSSSTYTFWLYRVIQKNKTPVGQFRAKKTRFEVTISKTSFLGPNLLVRPHVVHQVQFWPPSAILRPFLGSEWVFGPNWDQISKSLQEAIFMYFFELIAPKQLQLVYFRRFRCFMVPKQPKIAKNGQKSSYIKAHFLEKHHLRFG